MSAHLRPFSPTPANAIPSQNFLNNQMNNISAVTATATSSTIPETHPASSPSTGAIGGRGGSWSSESIGANQSLRTICQPKRKTSTLAARETIRKAAGALAQRTIARSRKLTSFDDPEESCVSCSNAGHSAEFDQAYRKYKPHQGAVTHDTATSHTRRTEPSMAHSIAMATEMLSQ